MGFCEFILVWIELKMASTIKKVAVSLLQIVVKIWVVFHGDGLHAPVVNLVSNANILFLSQPSEQVKNVIVIGFIFKSQTFAVAQVFGKFNWAVLAKFLNAHFLFHFFDLLVSFILFLGYNILPWKLASVKVNQHVSDCLEVISTR